MKFTKIYNLSKIKEKFTHCVSQEASLYKQKCVYVWLYIIH